MFTNSLDFYFSCTIYGRVYSSTGSQYLRLLPGVSSDNLGHGQAGINLSAFFREFAQGHRLFVGVSTKGLTKKCGHGKRYGH